MIIFKLLPPPDSPDDGLIFKCSGCEEEVKPYLIVAHARVIHGTWIFQVDTIPDWVT